MQPVPVYKAERDNYFFYVSVKCSHFTGYSTDNRYEHSLCGESNTCRNIFVLDSLSPSIKSSSGGMLPYMNANALIMESTQPTPAKPAAENQQRGRNGSAARSG